MRQTRLTKAGLWADFHATFVYIPSAIGGYLTATIVPAYSRGAAGGRGLRLGVREGRLDSDDMEVAGQGYSHWLLHSEENERRPWSMGAECKTPIVV